MTAMVGYYRLYELPWSPSAEAEQRFRRILRNVVGGCAVAGLSTSEWSTSISTTAPRRSSAHSMLRNAHLSLTSPKNCCLPTIRRYPKMRTIPEIAKGLLWHGYKLIIFDDLDYEIREIESGEVQWDWKNSGVRISEFDLDGFLDVAGKRIH